jgi:hypothetical protein
MARPPTAEEAREVATLLIVPHAIKDRIVDPGSRGYKAELAPAVDAKILSWITAWWDKQHHLRRRENSHKVRGVREVPIPKGWMNSFLKRHQDSWSTGVPHPHRNSGVQIQRFF